MGFSIHGVACGRTLQNGDFNAYALVRNKLVYRIANYALVREFLRGLGKGY
jgi:hypothetical protein